MLRTRRTVVRLAKSLFPAAIAALPFLLAACTNGGSTPAY